MNKLTLGSLGVRGLQAVGRVIMHCWALAGATLLSCLLLYWVLGGIIPFLLLCFAATGKKRFIILSISNNIF